MSSATEAAEPLDAASIAAKTSQLGAAGEGRRAVIAELQGSYARLAFDPLGCRLAQAVLDVASHAEQVEFALELRGKVWEALESPYANYVLQKVIEVLPPTMVGFVVEELSCEAVRAAQHCYGCRVLCRLLEHCSRGRAERIIDDLLQEATMLSRHKYGNYVIQHILEHGTARDQQTVARTLLVDPLGFAINRTASNVVERALAHCAAEDRSALLRVLLHDLASVAKLGCSRYGCRILRAVLELSGGEAAAARAMLSAAAQRLQESKYGQRLLAEAKLELD